MALKREVEPRAEKKKKPILFVQETKIEKNDVEVLIKQLATSESAQKYTRIEENVHQNAVKAIGAARVRRRPTFTPVLSKKKKVLSFKKKMLSRSLQCRC